MEEGSAFSRFSLLSVEAPGWSRRGVGGTLALTPTLSPGRGGNVCSCLSESTAASASGTISGENREVGNDESRPRACLVRRPARPLPGKSVGVRADVIPTIASDGRSSSPKTATDAFSRSRTLPNWMIPFTAVSPGPRSQGVGVEYVRGNHPFRLATVH